MGLRATAEHHQHPIRHAEVSDSLDEAFPPKRWQIMAWGVLNALLPGMPRFFADRGQKRRWLLLPIPLALWALGLCVVFWNESSTLLTLALDPVYVRVLSGGFFALSLWYLVTYGDLFRVVRFTLQKSSVKILTCVLFLLLAAGTAGGSLYVAYVVETGSALLNHAFQGGRKTLRSAASWACF